MECINRIRTRRRMNTRHASISCARASNACQHVSSGYQSRQTSQGEARLQVVDAHDGEGGEEGDAVVCTVDRLTHNALHLARGEGEADLHAVEFAVVHEAIH